MSLIAGLRRTWEEMKAAHELELLDDRSLRDLGIERHEIAAAVSGRLNRPAPKARVSGSASERRIAPQHGLLGHAA